MTKPADQEYYLRHRELCKTFSNANRLKLLDVLRNGEERTVTELTEATGVPQPTTSQHLKVMREREVVSRRKDGVESYYSVTDERFYDAIDLMREMTRERMEA